MRFSIWPSPAQPWESVLDVSRHAEATGWDGVWFADHFMPNAADTSGPTSEAWTTIAALAVSVPRVRIGTLVTGNTYRHPAVLAKMAANVDIISGGRLVLGLGSGWQENEHAAYGIEFSTVAGRLKRLEEACQLIISLFDNPKTDFDGKYYQLKDAPLAPKPEKRPTILIGGGGEKVTMRLAAKYADEWNVWGTPETVRQKMAILDQHCRDLGRDPKSLKRTTQAMVVVTDDEAVKERMRAAGERAVIAGTPAELRETMREYQEAGIDEFIVPDFNLGRGEAKKEAYDTILNEVAAEFR